LRNPFKVSKIRCTSEVTPCCLAATDSAAGTSGLLIWKKKNKIGREMVAENFDLLKSPNISPDDSREEFVCVFSLKLLHS